MSLNSSTTENKRRSKKTTNFSSTRRPRPASPNGRSSPPPSAAALADGGLLTEELSRFEAIQISPESANPRSFPYNVKQQCWDKAEKIKGRDPDRWRRDPLGNTVFRKLVGCPGCLCHDYDHIVPYSKGGKSTLENCQVLQQFTNGGTRLPSLSLSTFLRLSSMLSLVPVLTAFLSSAAHSSSSCLLAPLRQLLIDPRETGLNCPKASLFRRVLTAGFQVATWTFLSCRPMVMFVVGKILAGVTFNN